MTKINQDVLVTIVKKRLLQTDYNDLVTEDLILKTTKLYLDKSLTKAVEHTLADLRKLCKQKEKEENKSISLTDVLAKAFTRNW
jgi:hypothetical protein